MGTRMSHRALGSHGAGVRPCSPPEAEDPAGIPPGSGGRPCERGALCMALSRFSGAGIAPRPRRGATDASIDARTPQDTRVRGALGAPRSPARLQNPGSEQRDGRILQGKVSGSVGESCADFDGCGPRRDPAAGEPETRGPMGTRKAGATPGLARRIFVAGPRHLRPGRYL